ncbi:transposon Ty3-I Gag-Pol polyprotein [Trichonephila clavipes]|nr:transposon Ty3-I Gag-Pol polyprotein [Trichonephila clavipes]
MSSETPLGLSLIKDPHLLPPHLKIYITVKKQNILYISITTGLPRSNGQIEKQNSTIIAVLSKLSVDDPEKRYSHVPHLQEILNSTFQRSIKMTSFELLFGTKMILPGH